MTWQIIPDNDGRFRYTDAETGEIREYAGGFDAFVRDRDELLYACGRIANLLGCEAEWETDEIPPAGLAARVADRLGALAGYRAALLRITATARDQLVEEKPTPKLIP